MIQRRRHLQVYQLSAILFATVQSRADADPVHSKAFHFRHLLKIGFRIKVWDAAHSAGTP